MVMDVEWDSSEALIGDSRGREEEETRHSLDSFGKEKTGGRDMARPGVVARGGGIPPALRKA